MPEVNLLAVAVATIVAFVIGMLWYGPLFGKQWMKMMGYTPESMKAMKMSPMGSMIWMFVLSALLNYVLAHGILYGNIALNMSGVGAGLTGAFWFWLGFAVPFTAGSYLWENKSWKLWAFNALYYLVTFLVAGAIFGAWV
jgi:hypothetical protein